MRNTYFYFGFSRYKRSESALRKNFEMETCCVYGINISPLHLFIFWLLNWLQTCSENSELAFPTHRTKAHVSRICITLTSQACSQHSNLWDKQEWVSRVIRLSHLADPNAKPGLQRQLQCVFTTQSCHICSPENPQCPQLSFLGVFFHLLSSSHPPCLPWNGMQVWAAGLQPPPSALSSPSPPPSRKGARKTMQSYCKDA